MKNSLINSSKITVLLLLILASTSCSKESCAYVTDCVETEPEGYMVATMSNYDLSSRVGVIHKTTYNSNAPIGADWNNPALGTNQVISINPTMWNVNDIGQVFGIALNKTGGIYLSATDIYSYDTGIISTFGASGGRSGIYFTDITSPNVTTALVSTLVANTGNTVGTNKIPNNGGFGNSIGNIAYDKKNNQLFATNLEDGRIYRIDASTGIVKSIFDPFILDVPTNGIAPVNEQLWGIGVLTSNGITSVYFARTEATFNSIWYIDLNASGEFIANEVGTSKLFDDSLSSAKVAIPKIGVQNKITDIEFSCSGKMLMAERGQNPHNGSIFEYEKVGTTWSTTTATFYAGDALNVGKSSAGGVDYGARESGGSFTTDGIVWVSQNYASPVNMTPTYLCYGVQGISSAGNSSSTYGSTDLFIDRNAGGGNFKGGIGDVDIFDSSCPCNN
jgi:hypothetical protein